MVYGTRLWYNTHSDSKSDLRKDLEDNNFECTELTYLYTSFKRDVWACAFTTANSKETKNYYTKPTYGYSNGNNFKHYLKNGKLSKQSVSLSARLFTDTEEECIRLYNYLIDRENSKLKKIIHSNNELKI